MCVISSVFLCDSRSGDIMNVLNISFLVFILTYVAITACMNVESKRVPALQNGQAECRRGYGRGRRPNGNGGNGGGNDGGNNGGNGGGGTADGNDGGGGGDGTAGGNAEYRYIRYMGK